MTSGEFNRSFRWRTSDNPADLNSRVTWAAGTFGQATDSATYKRKHLTASVEATKQISLDD